jgi:hypothetical protein
VGDGDGYRLRGGGIAAVIAAVFMLRTSRAEDRRP